MRNGTATVALGAALVAIAVASASGEAKAPAPAEKCTAAAGRPSALPLARLRGRVAAFTVQCTEQMLGFTLLRPQHKRVSLDPSSVSISGGVEGDVITCTPARGGNNCEGSVGAGVTVRVRAVFRKPVCRKPQLRLRLFARLAPKPCPGPHPCVLEGETVAFESGAFAGCGPL